MNMLGLRWMCALAALLLAACSKPVPVPVREFIAPVPQEWQSAEADPAEPGAEWWTLYDDPGLDEVIRKALEQSGGNRTRAAALVRMKRTTFVMKLHRLGLS